MAKKTLIYFFNFFFLDEKEAPDEQSDIGRTSKKEHTIIKKHREYIEIFNKKYLTPPSLNGKKNE